jgi:hypothetical protein
LAVLRRVLPPASGTRVLEVASGTGEHAVFFAAALPHLLWEPTDLDEANLRSIDGWREAEAVTNVAPALRLDVGRHPWPVLEADALVCINMIHIAPWEACVALFAGAASTLRAGAPLVLYGPFREGGAHTAPSNEAFDAGLRAQDPRWGVRDLEAVVAVAREQGFRHEETVTMPANNRVVVFRRE